MSLYNLWISLIIQLESLRLLRLIDCMHIRNQIYINFQNIYTIISNNNWLQIFKDQNFKISAKLKNSNIIIKKQVIKYFVYPKKKLLNNASNQKSLDIVINVLNMEIYLYLIMIKLLIRSENIIKLKFKNKMKSLLIHNFWMIVLDVFNTLETII